jgi:hypothetical protein
MKKAPHLVELSNIVCLTIFKAVRGYAPPQSPWIAYNSNNNKFYMQVPGSSGIIILQAQI